MTHLITCMGELLIDFLPIEEHGTTVGFRMHAGGSPLNIAVGLARLGQPIAFASKVSTDYFGRYLRHYVETEGIDTRFLLNDDALSTLAFVAVEDNEPAYTFYGEGAADTLLMPDELPDALFEETRALHVGSISLLRGSTPDAIVAAVERLRGHALISCDPNIRAGLVRDEARYRALLDKLFGMVDLVKISAADLLWLMPEHTVEQAAADLLARGAALVVVTRGAAGAYAIRADADGPREWSIPGFVVPVADTVGAGDSFNSGLLAALAERDALSRAALLALPEAQVLSTLRFAAATAALTVQQAGANPPRRAAVEAFLQKNEATEHTEHIEI